jgi:serine/threonine-protein kinase HipA
LSLDQPNTESFPKSWTPMPEKLLVLFDQRVVGLLVRENDAVSFTYAPEVVDELEGRVFISASLRVRKRPFTQVELMPFFSGLLPEGNLRQRLATVLRLEYDDVFGLLREIGRDCAGALSIVPDGTDLKTLADEGVEWLDEAGLDALVASMRTRPLGVEPESDIRISLAGAQNKTVLVVDGKRTGRPRGTTPSTHILKPAPREQFPDLVSNEAVCMTLARLAGLQVADVEVVRIGQVLALLVHRYDRSERGGRIHRIHQEDFSQALRVLPSRKYQADGGPDLRRMTDLIRRFSAEVATDVDEFVDRVAFNYLIGNADAHAKNFSILYADGPRLAPGYDLVSTEVYPEVKRDLATSIGGEYRPERITPERWRREFTRLDLNVQRYSRRLADFATRVVASVPEAFDWLTARGAAADRLKVIADTVDARSKVLVALAE